MGHSEREASKHCQRGRARKASVVLKPGGPSQITKLSQILSSRNRLLSTEFLPPSTPSVSGLVDKVLKVAKAIDSVSIPELKANPRNRGKFRMGSLYTALRVRQLTGVEPVFHLTPRDLNRNAIGGLLLAALEGGVENLLVVGGDRYSKEESRQLAKNVYDFSGSLDLIRGVRSFETEQSAERHFCVIAGTDPTVIYSDDRMKIESEVSRLVEKQDAGADLAQTQPVFDLRIFEFLDKAREQGLKIPVLLGILPIRGKRDSEEIARRYGILIPQEFTASFTPDGPDSGEEVASKLAKELVSKGERAIHVYPRESCEFLLRVAAACFDLHQN